MTTQVKRPSPPPQPFPEAWAASWGLDEYGWWMGFCYKGVEQVLRWIGPGTFLMGSPQSEKGRYSDEVLHEVSLTQGFWLAETTVTQALWLAVMGENPSRFKGDDLPVEMVSWDEAQAFMARLNDMEPALRLCLPSEAQWEYACRAGNQAAFSFGNDLDLSKVNYRGIWERTNNIEWGEGALQQTAAVKKYPANAWGLYQMHGNVYEWCQDWLGEYPGGPVTDPAGPEAGDRRVLRGGAWSSYGWNCRSASRFGLPPDRRDDVIGFRLARGHQGG